MQVPNFKHQAPSRRAGQAPNFNLKFRPRILRMTRMNVWCACMRPASDQVRPKKYEYDPKRQNRTSAQGRPGTGQPPAGEGRFRSADLPSALDTRTTNTTVTNPAVARRSDAQSRSETGAPADASNNFGRHGPEVEAGNLSGHRPGVSGYIRVNPAIENYK